MAAARSAMNSSAGSLLSVYSTSSCSWSASASRRGCAYRFSGWPLIARTISNDQWAWNFLWPLIWIRHYQDPTATTDQTRVIPFYWNSYTKRDDGSGSEFDQVWPLYRRTSKHDGEQPIEGEWHSLAIWPWQLGNATGVREMYGWMWTLAQGKRRAADDDSTELIANLYTTRKRGSRRQTSVPFLFSYDGDDQDGTLRLFQLIPIPWGGTGKPVAEERD